MLICSIIKNQLKQDGVLIKRLDVWNLKLYKTSHLVVKCIIHTDLKQHRKCTCSMDLCYTHMIKMMYKLLLILNQQKMIKIVLPKSNNFTQAVKANSLIAQWISNLMTWKYSLVLLDILHTVMKTYLNCIYVEQSSNKSILMH